MGDRIAGAGGSVSLDGVVISFTKWSGTIEKKLADSTDSGDFDTGAGLLFGTQEEVRGDIKVEVEGRFRKSTTPNDVIGKMYSNTPGGFATILKHDAATTFGHGQANLSNVVLSQPVDDVVTFTASLTSYGKWTLGS